ncbi:alpha/beta fold hydrolase [Streptomyces sp. NPDC053427]|uniref:alpha/beta fold hydrolase n=1 Tax=Streptomyces sp. NPDC053427 TaxID=3365701 RepID=UPI0037D874EB
MNDLGELQQYIVAHAHAQRVPRATYREVLARIRGDEDGGPGSWAAEWSAAARAAAHRGRHLDASRLYTIARFPYVDGPARQQAAEASVRSFGDWARGQQDIHRLELRLDGERVVCWATGLSETDRRPLLLVMGGIVSTKEQWGPVLAHYRRQGMAGIVTEMPGVGENTLPYDRDSPRLISRILDAVRDRADVDRTYALAMSFSGHLALRCALDDRRIRGIVTSGAPVAGFFEDAGWLGRVPRITVDTLAHLTGVTPDKLPDHLRDWALTPRELAGLDIPVHYVTCLRDEIIPPGEPTLLRERVERLRLLEIDDVHGSPGHAEYARLWCGLALQQLRGAGGPQTAVLRGLLGLVGARDRFLSGRERQPRRP